MESKTYSLRELVKVDIDSWVEAMAWLSDHYLDECLKKYADEDGREGWRRTGCPAELEEAFTELSDGHGFRYNADGSVANASVEGNK